MMPPIDTSLIPANVRNAGPRAVKLYQVAMQFEGLLTSQITQQMFDSSQTDDGSDGGPYQSMLPGALSDSITADGGLGLAGELYRSLGGTYAAAPADGTAPQGSGS